MKVLLYSRNTEHIKTLSNIVLGEGAEIIIAVDKDTAKNKTADVALLERIEGWKEIMTVLSKDSDCYLLDSGKDPKSWQEVTEVGGKGVIQPIESEIKEIINKTNKITRPSMRSTLTKTAQNVRSQLIRPTQPLETIDNTKTAGRRIPPILTTSTPKDKIITPFKREFQNRKNSSAANSGVIHKAFQKELIVFYSPKGGVGKTTLSVNSSVLLAKNHHCAIVDFDIQQGDVAKFLCIEPKRTILDWVEGRYFEDIKNFMEEGPSGLHVLPAPLHPYGEGAITAQTAKKVLDTLYRRFDYVVVDTGSNIHDPIVLSFDCATKIFIVIDNYRVTLEAALNMVSRLTVDMCIPREKIQVIINDMPKRSTIKASEISFAFEEKGILTAGVIPRDEALKTVVNRKEIPVESRLTKPFTDGVRRFVGTFAHVADTQKHKFKFWPWPRRWGS